MYILGLSAFYHDSAACLLKDGDIIAAAQEERFTRKKHDASFPKNAISYCLKEADIDAVEIESVVFYEKPFVKFERLLETYIAFAPKGFKSFAKALPVWARDKLFQKRLLVNELKSILGPEVDWKSKLLFSEHHLSHAASAFFPSPFAEAAVLTIDGVGEWATTAVSIGSRGYLEIVKEIRFPHSLGLLYSAFTYYLGFKVNSGEYKVMGLAPYGEPLYADRIYDHLIAVSEDGSFQLDMSYFSFATGLTMTNKKFDLLFDGPPRKPETELTQREMDLAASIQKVTEDIVIRIAKAIASETGQKNLCLAGGVALNCVVNSAIKRESIFEGIWIQPAAGDAGGALGAALVAWHLHHNGDRKLSVGQDAMRGAYLGPQFSETEIAAELDLCGSVYRKLSDDELIETVANALTQGKAVGWMQGRMEFGPRSLGGRSIIADPRSTQMQKQLNLKIKYRESFRPFAPSVLAEDLEDWFDYDTDSPYMLFVANVLPDKRIPLSPSDKDLSGLDKLKIPRTTVPAITHVDYSARVQTVHSETNPRFHRLISNFKEKTGCSLLVNTSFNVRGEPIVCSPTDAFKCFMGTDLDVLALENFYLVKEDQSPNLRDVYVERYELD